MVVCKGRAQRPFGPRRAGRASCFFHRLAEAVALLLLGALVLSVALHPPSALTGVRCAAPAMLARKEGWSIGKARKKGKSRDKDVRPAARGFGAAVLEEPAPAPASTYQAAAAPTTLAPADLNANDLAASAAAAGGDTWRAYAEAAMAQVAELEASADSKHVSAQELLAREGALEELKARRGR